MKPHQYLRNNTDISGVTEMQSSAASTSEPSEPATGEAEQTLGTDNETGQDTGPNNEIGETLGPNDETPETPGANDATGEPQRPDSEAEESSRTTMKEDDGAKAVRDDKCWFPINAQKHFSAMDELDRKYAAVSEQYQHAVASKNFDKEMLDRMLKTRAVAERALQNFGGEASVIPAGLDLGGFFMMRMPQSILFFHRLKLRNNTRFRVNYLHNDLKQMTLTANLSLNDLHFFGNYERVVTYEDPSDLFYRPTHGDIEFLMRSVEYKMEGRYRLLQNRLNIEHVISKLTPSGILMRYSAEPAKMPIQLGERNIDEYLLKIQNDLDSWLKDYFNDFLIYFGLAGAKINAQFQLYENEKTIVLNQFADKIIKQARHRMRQMNSSSVKIPHFTIYAVNGLQIKLKDGVVRGLDSIYRRSVATGKKEGDIRRVNTNVGFSNLKVEYRYEAFVKTGIPPIFGLLILNADDLTARMAVGVVQDSDTIDLNFKFLKQAKMQTLTIEGPANMVIGNFKHILEHHIIAIMSSTLIHAIHELGFLARCDPLMPGNDDPNYKNIDDDESESKEYQNTDPSVNQDDETTEPQLSDRDGETNDPPITDHDSETTEPPLSDHDVETNDPPISDHDVETTEPPLSDHGGEIISLGDDPEAPETTVNLPAADYIVSKDESVELELPPKPGAKKGETMLLKAKQKFTLTRLNKGGRKTG